MRPLINDFVEAIPTSITFTEASTSADKSTFTICGIQAPDDASYVQMVGQLDDLAEKHGLVPLSGDFTKRCLTYTCAGASTQQGGSAGSSGLLVAGLIGLLAIGIFYGVVTGAGLSTRSAAMTA